MPTPLFGSNPPASESGDSSWSLNERWSTGWIRSEARSTRRSAWAVALLWNAMCTPFLFGLPDLVEREGAGVLAFVLIFPAIGLVLLAHAARETWRTWRFGEPLFEPTGLPIPLGGNLEGRLHARDALRAAKALTVRVVCAEPGSPGNETEVVLWSQQKKLDMADAQLGPKGLALPISIPIPSDMKPSHPEPTEADGIRWRLEIESELPGIDYAAQFLVPVVETDASNAAWTRASLVREPAAASGSATSEATVRPRSDSPSRVRIGPPAQGGEGQVALYFPPQRRIGITILVAFAFAFFGLITWAIHQTEGPSFFAFVFAAACGLLVFSALAIWFLHVRVTAGPEGVHVERRMFFIPVRKFVPREKIERVVVESTSNGYWGLRLDPVAGHAPVWGGVWRIEGGGTLRQRPEAERLAAEITRALGLRPSGHEHSARRPL